MTLEREGAVTAAELALGVLDGEEKAAAMRRVLAEPEFAREVERWRTHFAEMFAEVDAVETHRMACLPVSKRPCGRGEAAGYSGRLLPRRWRRR